MRKILTDYDGILIETEWAKGLGWYIACLSLREDEPDINEQFIKDIEQKRESARRAVEQLAEERKKEAEMAKSFAGGTRYQFAKKIWQEFYLSEGDKREPDDRDKEFIMNVLAAQRGRIKGPVLEWFSRPIKDNLRFFRELYEAMKDTYADSHPIGLITLSKASAIREQFEWVENGLTIWKEFPGISSLFGELGELKYRYAECAGDGGIAYIGVPEDQVKTVGYKLLCGRMGVHPHETITFEDTESGLNAAHSAGVKCVGYKPKNSSHDLSEADAIIDNLYSLKDIIPIMLREDASDVILAINELQKTISS